MEVEVKEVLHMKEGTGETSYAKSSCVQKQVLSLTRFIKEEAMREFYQKERPQTICIADLGCSSAEPNTLGVVLEIIAAAEEARRRLGDGPREYHVCLNDLPGNDFNTLFRSLPRFEEKLRREIIMGDGETEEVKVGEYYCFVNGVPGSFYGRLFPSNTLHFVHSSYSLMWLSQVPRRVEENDGNIYIAKTSPPSVVGAYFEQFQKDFTMFLRCRSKEVVGGGRMVLTFLGRETDEPYSEGSSYMWDLLASALNDMVSEGLIEKEKLKTFNIPQYNPSPTEVRKLVEEEGSFAVNQVHVSEVSWQSGNNNNGSSRSSSSDGFVNHDDQDQDYDFAKCMRSVAEPLLVSHFGQEMIEQVFQRYGAILRIALLNQNYAHVNVTVAVTRKG